MDSIFDSVKKLLNVSLTDTAFDTDILIHINSVFGTLHQLGVGPSAGFSIEDNTATWSDFIAADIRLNAVKTYVYMKVRLVFDPPQTAHLVNALEEQIKELEWRLTAVKDGDPVPVPETLVLDGGEA